MRLAVSSSRKNGTKDPFLSKIKYPEGPKVEEASEEGGRPGSDRETCYGREDEDRPERTILFILVTRVGPV